MRKQAVSGAAEPLTAREQALFDLLSGNPGRLFTRGEIVQRVWGVEFGGDDRVVDVYVRRLRRKLRGPVIETVRGAGYRHPDGQGGRQDLPHLGHLSPDARMLLEVWRRLAGAGSSREVLGEALASLAANLPVSALALLAAPGERGGGWTVRETCGEEGVAWPMFPAEAAGPVYRPAGVEGTRGVALLPLTSPAGEPWGALAAALRPGARWDDSTCAGVEAVAVLAHAALRVEVEAEGRRRAQVEAQVLHAELERRVAQRTEALGRANSEQTVLGGLCRVLERARSSGHVLEVGLPVLARLAGTSACAAVWPHRGGPPVCFRADGTPGSAPAGVDGGLWLRLDVDGDEFVLHAFDEAGCPSGTGEASALLGAAAESVAHTLSRLLELEALEAAALTDEDTGLGNRGAFLSDLAAEVAYSSRYGTGFGLGLVDIANIRSLNATVGYAGGNDVIGRVADTLRGTRRAEDRVYRLCGATFAVLLRYGPQDRPGHGTGSRALEGWRERLRVALEDLARGAPFPLELSSSEVGCPGDARTVSDLLRVALGGLRPGFPAPLPPRRVDVGAHG